MYAGSIGNTKFLFGTKLLLHWKSWDGQPTKLFLPTLTIGGTTRTDSRVGPTNYTYEFAQLKELTEHAFAINNNTKVAFTSLSMGGPYAIAFFNAMTQQWKDTYVDSFTSFRYLGFSRKWSLGRVHI